MANATEQLENVRVTRAGQGRPVKRNAMLNTMAKTVYRPVPVRTAPRVIVGQVLVPALLVGMASHVINRVLMTATEWGVYKDAVVRTMLFVILWMALVHVATASPARYVWTNVSAQTGHHASLMVHVLVNRDGLDKDVTNHVLLVRSELGVHRNAYVKTEHTVIRQMEPALVHQVGWGMSVMSNVRRGITDLTAEMCVLA